MKRIDALCHAFLCIKSREEVFKFLSDLCTPKELNAMADRWRVCQLLSQDTQSYREIHALTGVSLTTIGRVARSLHDPIYQGYRNVLKHYTEKS